MAHTIQEGKPIIALCYDFDGTLSPGNMQEYAFVRKVQRSPKKFWEEAQRVSKESDADEILAYMYQMCKTARAMDVKVTRHDFLNFGKKVKLFPGVREWFSRINRYAQSLGAQAKHYVISSGIKEMIEGTAIGKEFDRIYASSFIYSPYGEAVWPAMAVNYTTKMQFLFRINKGILDIQDTINNYMPDEERPVPFRRMIYFGDGMTDIPAMKLVKTQNGFSIAVHNGKAEKKRKCERLLHENRVHFVTQADYREGSPLDAQVKRVIQKIMLEYQIDRA